MEDKSAIEALYQRDLRRARQEYDLLVAAARRRRDERLEAARSRPTAVTTVATAHKPQYRSAGLMLDQYVCSCGWESETFFDGAPDAMAEFQQHVADAASRNACEKVET